MRADIAATPERFRADLSRRYTDTTSAIAGLKEAMDEAKTKAARRETRLAFGAPALLAAFVPVVAWMLS